MVHVSNSVGTMGIKLMGVGITVRSVYMPHVGHEAAMYFDRMGFLDMGMDNQLEILCADTNVEGLDDREHLEHAEGEDFRRGAFAAYSNSRSMQSGRDEAGPRPPTQKLRHGREEAHRLHFRHGHDGGEGI